MLSDNELQRMEAEFRRSSRRAGVVILAFGAGMFALSFYLASDHVPLLRQTRLMIGFGIGAAATVAGTVRCFNPHALRDWF